MTVGHPGTESLNPGVSGLCPLQAKPALKTPPTKVSPRKSTPATPPPSTVSTAGVGTPTPWRAGTLASLAVTKDTQKAEEDSSSSEESESEEETAATAVGQVRSGALGASGVASQDSITDISLPGISRYNL